MPAAAVTSVNTTGDGDGDCANPRVVAIAIAKARPRRNRIALVRASVLTAGELLEGHRPRPAELAHTHLGRVVRARDPALEMIEMIPNRHGKLGRIPGTRRRRRWRARRNARLRRRG